MKKFMPFLLLALMSGCGDGGDGIVASGGAPPVVTLAMATTVTENSAILNGTVIPNGLSTEWWFEYGENPSLAGCDNGARQTLAPGIANMPVTYELGGLAAGTTYYYRICASNILGTSKSSIAGFTTSWLGAPPTVITLAATSVAATGAALNGSVTPNGLATNSWFEWGTDNTLTVFSSTATQSMGSGMTSMLVSVPLTGLSTGVTYYCRVAAANSSGTSRGNIVSFVPGSPPIALTVAATSVTTTGATINGYVTPNGLPTNAWFAWGTDPTLSVASITPTRPIGLGTTACLVSEQVNGLSVGTTYYFRVFASNGSGTSWGSIVGFTAGSAPSVGTGAATAVSGTGATLNGNVTPNGLSTTAWFEWGTDSTLTSRSATAPQPVGSGTTGQSVSAALTGLSVGTTYYFRVAATNSSGTSRGTIESFAPVSAPSVTTRAATALSGAGATLNGNVTPNGLAATAWFEWGADPALSSPNVTDAQDVGSGYASILVSHPVIGLSDNTTYYFRIASQNSAGVSRGRVSSFVAASGTSRKCVAYQIDTAHSGRVSFGVSLSFPTSATWRVVLADTVSYPVIADGKVFVTKRASGTGGYGTQLYALDLATGGIAWGPVTIAGTYFRTGHAYDNEKIFVVNFNGDLRSFDSNTGTPGWSTNLGASWVEAPPIAANGIVYVSGGGRLFAVEGRNGNILWSRSVSTGAQSGPTLSEDGVFVTWNKFDPFTGSPLWQISGGGYGSTSAYADGLLYARDYLVNPVGSVFDADNGSRIAGFGSSSMLPIPAIGDNSAFLMSYGTLQAVDPVTLSVKWSFTGGGGLVSAPIVIDQVVIVGSSSGTVYALDAVTGAQIWSGSSGAAIYGPDEWNVSGPLTGLGAGEGYLVVPAANTLSAWRIAEP